MKTKSLHVDYELRLLATESATGYFGCAPSEDFSTDELIDYVHAHPNDEFMRRHLARRIAGWEEAQLLQSIASARRKDPFLLALLWEACELRPDSAKWSPRFFSKNLQPLAGLSPLVDLKAHLRADRRLHQKWIGLFRANIFEHRVLPQRRMVKWPAPYPEEEINGLLSPALTLKEMHEKSSRAVEVTGLDKLPPEVGNGTQRYFQNSAIRERPVCFKERTGRFSASLQPLQPERLGRSRLIAAGKPLPPENNLISAEAVHALAVERLNAAEVTLGQEMRHTSSLSPIAILRRWQMKTSVRSGRHDFSFSGELTAYGRGIDFEAARAACVMEIVERYSSFASFDPRGPVGYAAISTRVRGRLSDLRADKLAVLDPNDLAIEVPYGDEPLYWVEGVEQTLDGPRPIFIPAQCVFLFCNLDEIKLFSALGSTGLGSGVSAAGAKLSALTEVIERDSQGTTLYTPELCFEIETSEPRLAGLLESYRQNGIHIQFQDITPPMGLPCCKCFVVGADGRIAKGTGASLDARGALLAALTETPYPFPGGPASRPAMDGLLRVPVEALPNYSTGSPEQDLRTLETLLVSNGFRVIYADLTRSDIGLPVMRAIVPGMEILADFDRFSRVHPRLYANYLKLSDKREA
jgi:YcaO-like protein with predicted kinase domain